LQERSYATEIVVKDSVGRHTEILEHVHDRRAHEWRSAKEILCSLGRRMALQVLLVNDRMNQTRSARPLVTARRRESGLPVKIRMSPRELIEFVLLTEVLHIASAVPEPDRAPRAATKLVENDRPYRRDARTPGYEHHLLITVAGMKLPEGS